MKKQALLFTLLALLFSAAITTHGQDTEIRWHGHAAFSITTPKGKVILIDPWLRNPKNPDAANKQDPMALLTKADYILLTHGHGDHMGESVEISKKTGAILIANPELAMNMVKLRDFPANKINPMGIGGEITIADGEVTIAMTSAVHSSSVANPKADAADADRAYGGNPAGFVVIVKDGPTIYHTGDTAYFKDMETIGEQYQIDLALLNIGGHYGMMPKMAAKAAVAVKAKRAVPMHFGTFEGIAQNTTEFSAELKRLKAAFYEMKPGETMLYRGKTALVMREIRKI